MSLGGFINFKDLPKVTGGTCSCSLNKKPSILGGLTCSDSCTIQNSTYDKLVNTLQGGGCKCNLKKLKFMGGITYCSETCEVKTLMNHLIQNLNGGDIQYKIRSLTPSHNLNDGLNYLWKQTNY
jgi:hypothetical protein